MRPDRARAGRPDPDEPELELDAERFHTTEVEEPDDPDATPPTTVWRADHERVATGPLRPHGTGVYNPEDEPLQAVTDRPARSTETTRGRPSTDASGLSTAEDRPARTGSPPRDRSGGGPPPP